MWKHIECVFKDAGEMSEYQICDFETSIIAKCTRRNPRENEQNKLFFSD